MIKEWGFMKWHTCPALNCYQGTQLRYCGKSQKSETLQLVARPRQEPDKPKSLQKVVQKCVSVIHIVFNTIVYSRVSYLVL